MARTPRQVQSELLALAPPGSVFPQSTSAYFAALLLGPASEFSLAEASIEAMLPEIDIRQAYNLLPDYERVLGPNPCGQDLFSLGFDQRAAIAFSRWVAGGNICAGYFERLAALLGVEITINEVQNWICGASTCDDLMVPYGENFAIQVNLPTNSVTNWECGASTCDDSLGLIVASLAVCALNCAAPLHTRFYFNFTADPGLNTIELEDGSGSIELEDGGGFILQET